MFFIALVKVGSRSSEAASGGNVVDEVGSSRRHFLRRE